MSMFLINDYFIYRRQILTYFLNYDTTRAQFDEVLLLLKYVSNEKKTLTHFLDAQL